MDGLSQILDPHDIPWFILTLEESTPVQPAFTNQYVSLIIL